MFSRSVSWLICIFVAVVIATDYSEADSITGTPRGQDLIKAGQPLSDQPAGTSAPAAGGSGAAPTAAPTAATAAPPRVVCPTSPLSHTAVSLLSNLSQEEKGKRLIKAAEEGDVDELLALLMTGVDKEAREEEYGKVALHFAACKGHVVAAKCLLDAGAKVDARDRSQETPLHCAADYGHTAVVRLLLAASADPNARSTWGRTPLYTAVTNGRTKAAALLLAAGADRAASDGDGRTPLDQAWQRFDQHLVHLLKCT